MTDDAHVKELVEPERAFLCQHKRAPEKDMMELHTAGPGVGSTISPLYSGACRPGFMDVVGFFFSIPKIIAITCLFFSL